MAYEPRSDFLRTLKDRGFIQDCTDMQGLDEALLDGIVPGYIGFDCTATSLHVGSLVQIMMLRWLQKTGHKPVTLMGGGTTRIGDPSGPSAPSPHLAMHYPHLAGRAAGVPWPLLQPPLPSAAVLSVHRHWF